MLRVRVHVCVCAHVCACARVCVCVYSSVHTGTHISGPSQAGILFPQLPQLPLHRRQPRRLRPHVLHDRSVLLLQGQLLLPNLMEVGDRGGGRSRALSAPRLRWLPEPPSAPTSHVQCCPQEQEPGTHLAWGRMLKPQQGTTSTSPHGSAC